MDYALSKTGRDLLEKRHDFVVFSEGEATDAHFVDAVNVKLGKELHVVVDVSLVALEYLAAKHSRAHQLSHPGDVLRIKERQPQERLLPSVVAIEI